MADNIVYKQWTSTAWTIFYQETLIKPRDEFFELFAEKVSKLRNHHYISKIKTKFLKEWLETVTEEEL